jgi:prephenate dehydratase
MTDRYAYLGPEGTFSEAALAAFDPTALAGALPCATIQATLEAVRSGEAARGDRCRPDLAGGVLA